MTKRFFAFASFALPFLFAGIASAADAPPKPGDPDATPPAESTPFKHVTLTANPLSLALGRIGANVEYLPVPHHAIVANPYFWSISVSSTDGSTSSDTKYTNFGGELGYHFYTGSKGANGFFVGPSLIAMSSSVSSSASSGSSSASGSSSIFAYGGALDIGGQHVFDSGFTIGGGAGVMWLTASNSNTASSSTFKLSGTLPRFLFTVGYSF